ncbi:hypothetical protein SAMN05444422_105277 [Halobiforma haloterrestris]|uniref:Uncharacterized protein n=1 Tax=Natronobacterium haloterrestre TaxID=148448 RepID=A0A1I1HAR5_NATHA|nr:hypothetical protein [Halobiforma haloterrestris]SFC20815.1 hypothetical protein SAMN05444422_105277 [Halobiforma haloterrestris]
MRRRTVLASTGSVALASLSGCLSSVRGFFRDEEIDGHESGEIEVVVEGESIDFTADRFQAENAEDSSVYFHFHEGHEPWFMERKRVTFAEAIDLLPHFAYENADGNHVVTFDGTTYDERDDGTTIRFEIDGEAVDPTERKLYDGDELSLEIETED